MPRINGVLVSLVALAVLATACGGSGDSSSPSASTGSSAPAEAVQTEPSGVVTSSDGLLTVAKPADGTEITIDLLAPEPADGLVVPVGAYELGPTGSTFDPPLAAHVTLTEQAMNQGIVILHEKDDGVVESVAFDFDATGASFEIAGFSGFIITALGPYDIEFQGPSEGFVGDVVNVELVPLGTGTNVADNAVIVTNRSEYIVTASLVREGANIICGDEGFGTVFYDGKVQIDGTLHGRPYTWRTFSQDSVVASHGVNCKRRTTIEPDDSNCQFRVTGENASGCPEDVQVGLSVNENGSLDLSIGLNDQFTATWSYALQTGNEFLLQEFSETGEYNAFYGAGFESFIPAELSDSTVERSGQTVVFKNFLSDVYSQDPLQVASPAGETAGGQQVAAGSMSLLDLTVFTSEETPDGEVQGTYTFFPENVADAIASMLLEISGAPAQP